MRHICRRLGAARPPLWLSPAWELQVVRRQLCTSRIISDARTASVFLKGYRPLPGCSQLPLYMQRHGHCTIPSQTARFLKAVPRKKSLDIINFLKCLEFWRNIMNQMMQLETHGFRAILYVCHEMVPSSQQPPEGGCWAPLSCSWGTEGCPTGPRPGARHTLQHGRPPSSGTWGALLFPFGRLAGAHNHSVPCSGKKIVLVLENS
jgi:hypothetical protein